jgi:molecular chaperone GrpE (heat shock protein)
MKASVLQDFLPALERLNELNQEYASNNFAMKNYSTLSMSYAGALKSLGLSEYTLEVGSKVDHARANVVQEEVSDLFPESGYITSVLKKGYELNGNVVRAAEVVASTVVSNEA